MNKHTPPTYIYLSLSLLWVYSGIVPLLFNQQPSMALLAAMEFGHQLSWLLFISASIIDVLFALLILTKYRHMAKLWALQIITVIMYNALMLLFMPTDMVIDQLIHPFAPLIKNIVIIALLAQLYQYHHSSD